MLLKYWLEVSPEEQTKRLESRINDGRKLWKLTEMDLKSYSRWHDYTRARDEMFLKTDTAWAPWHVAQIRRQKAGAAQYHHPLTQVKSHTRKRHARKSNFQSATKRTATSSLITPLS